MRASQLRSFALVLSASFTLTGGALAAPVISNCTTTNSALAQNVSCNSFCVFNPAGSPAGSLVCDTVTACGGSAAATEARMITFRSAPDSLNSWVKCGGSSTVTSCCSVTDASLEIDAVSLAGTTFDDYLYFNYDNNAFFLSTFNHDTQANLWGNGGDDYLEGSDEDDPTYFEFLYGGDDDDIISGDWSGNPFNVGGPETVFGGDGDDQVKCRGGFCEVTGGAGIDRLIGGSGLNWLKGGAGGDYLFGYEGDDRLDGGEGDDLLCGGEGNSLYDSCVSTTGTGNDEIRGGYGSDFVYSYDGGDELCDVDGGTFDSGDGDDKLMIPNASTFVCGAGTDDINSGLSTTATCELNTLTACPFSW